MKLEEFRYRCRSNLNALGMRNAYTMPSRTRQHKEACFLDGEWLRTGEWKLVAEQWPQLSGGLDYANSVANTCHHAPPLRGKRGDHVIPLYCLDPAADYRISIVGGVKAYEGAIRLACVAWEVRQPHCGTLWETRPTNSLRGRKMGNFGQWDLANPDPGHYRDV